MPSNKPTASPSVEPSFNPTIAPSIEPSIRPSFMPSIELSVDFTIKPSFRASVNSVAPSVSSSGTTEANPEPVLITAGGVFKGSVNSESFIIDSSADLIITGGGGRDIYKIMPHENMKITITDFNAYFDKINLQAFDLFSVDEVKKSGAVIHLENNQIIELLNLDSNDLNESNFIFRNEPSEIPSSHPYEKSEKNDLSIIAGVSASAALVFLGMVGCCVYNYWKGNNKVYAANDIGE